MKDLPQAWQDRRLVQISDVHLGMCFGVGFLEGVVRRVNAENPAVVFITGDLFDSGDLSLNDFVTPLSGFQVPLGVYFVTGNHETYYYCVINRTFRSTIVLWNRASRRQAHNRNALRPTLRAWRKPQGMRTEWSH